MVHKSHHKSKVIIMTIYRCVHGTNLCIVTLPSQPCWGSHGRAPHQSDWGKWAVHQILPRHPPPQLQLLQHRQRHHADQAEQARHPQPVRAGRGPAHQLCRRWHQVPCVRLGQHHELLWVCHPEVDHYRTYRNDKQSLVSFDPLQSINDLIVSLKLLAVTSSSAWRSPSSLTATVTTPTPAWSPTPCSALDTWRAARTLARYSPAPDKCLKWNYNLSRQAKYHNLVIREHLKSCVVLSIEGFPS